MMSESDAVKYGRFYYCVKVAELLAEDGEIYVMADEVLIEQGVLVFRSAQLESGDMNTLVIAPGLWKCYYAASTIDGSAISVEHWKGEIDRNKS